MGVISRYRDRLPVTEATPELSLGEGSTPLVAAPRLSERLGVELYLKCEGANPTGSFKDRGMVVAVAKAVEQGSSGIVCASTGNTAASAAAYAARAGMPAIVLHPAGAIAGGKLVQARAAGARIIAVDGSFEDTFAEALRLVDETGYTLVNSINSFRREGQKTAAFEIVEELGRPPDAIALPYGGGGNARSYGQGLVELGVQSKLVLGEASDRSATFASAIRIVEPAHAHALNLLEASVISLGEAAIAEAWREVATLEGIFCEPASAAGIAAVKQLDMSGRTVVCVVTGHGLKDPGAVESHAEEVAFA